MQCCCGWFSNEIWSCRSAINNSWFPTTKTVRVKTKQNEDRKPVENKELGNVLIYKTWTNHWLLASVCFPHHYSGKITV